MLREFNVSQEVHWESRLIACDRILAFDCLLPMLRMNKMAIPDNSLNGFSPDARKGRRGAGAMLSVALLLMYAAVCMGAVGEKSPPKGYEQKKTDTLVVHFFGAADCGECLKIRRNILVPIAEKHKDLIDLRIHDTNNTEEFRLLCAMKNACGVKGPSARVLFVSDRAIVGCKDITADAEDVITQYLQTPQKWRTYIIPVEARPLDETLAQKLDRFSIFGIIAAGIADGINPCAIATMIFLISFLATRKKNRRQVLVVGLCFTLSVYVTYFLLGLGAFKVLTGLEVYQWLAEAMRWLAVALAGVVGILCFIDALRYNKTHRTDTIRVQLPQAVKTRIHKVISSRLGGVHLIIGAVVTGFLVTLLEAVCTGQVYLPTIVLMTKSPTLRGRGWLYLLFYNVLFVLPLLIVMIGVYFGLTWERLAKATQNHLVLLKVSCGIVLIALAVFVSLAG